MYSGNGLGDASPAIAFVNKTSSARLFSPAVGDKWSITITGPANSPVVVTGGMNGANVPAAMGSTDSKGSFAIAGSFAADQIGAWYEDWTVGGQHAGVLQFHVTPAIAGDAPLNPGAGASGPDAPEVALGPYYVGGGSVSSILDGLPAWAPYAAAGVLLYLFFGGRSR